MESEMLECVKDGDVIGFFATREYKFVAFIEHNPDSGYVPKFIVQDRHKLDADDLRQIASKLEELNGK